MGVGNKRTLTKTRRKTRDIDQIKADLLSPKHLSQHQDAKAKEDLPALGRWYCVECAKWYDTEVNLVMHRKGKPHKRRYAWPSLHRADAAPEDIEHDGVSKLTCATFMQSETAS
ncbi:zinc finger protein [Nemania serpens]|nr:zinc finger protein [Nemania serpens]